jgi:16S rRNA (guanine527-N7)-methyltransferase
MNIADRLIADAEQLGVTLSADAAATLLRYLDLLAKWNRRISLTALSGRDEMRVRHLLDSLSVVPFVAGTRILDVGTGPGLPGIPLAVARPQTRVSLLESRERKVQFLIHAVAALHLSNAEVCHARLENLEPDDPFDTLVARAFAPLPRLLERCSHLCRPGTRLVAMTGKNPALTGRLAFAQIADVEVRRVQVPGLSAERHLVIMTWA